MVACFICLVDLTKHQNAPGKKENIDTQTVIILISFQRLNFKVITFASLMIKTLCNFESSDKLLKFYANLSTNCRQRAAANSLN